MRNVNCFKAYDIRGRVPDELNEEIAYRIGRAYTALLKPGRVIVGRDIRLTSASLADALAKGLMDGGSDVYDIGLCGTEQVYFATFHEQMDGGIMITASHNPMDYNGMKLVRSQSRPISGDSGLNDIRDMVKDATFETSEKKGARYELDIEKAYVEHLLSYVDVSKLRPLKIVVNAGNGCAGRSIDLLEVHLPVSFIKIQHEADGNFPGGIPNPLLPENRTATIAAIKEHQADLGIAWDGDFDRCFFFDADGTFIEGYYIVGLLASTLLAKHQGARVIHDPRLTWNTIDMVTKAGGIPVMSKTGHAFIKERMRREDAVYGGEMSAHHYFRDFAYCDSGMIPWLLVLEIMSTRSMTLSDLIHERMSLFPASGEINSKVEDASSVLAKIESKYADTALLKDTTDGLSLEFTEWRFNVRTSNTEPLLRLNVESRQNETLMKEKTEELLKIIQMYS